MTKTMMKPALLTLALTVLIAGCAQIKETTERVKKVQETTVALRDKAVAGATNGAITRTSKPRLAGDEITLRAENALPDVFSKPVTYSTFGAMSFTDVLDGIASMSGISIRASEIAPAQATPTPGLPPLPGQATTGLSGKVQIDYSGSLRSLLDELAARNDASWRFVSKSQTVEFYKFETRTFAVNLPQGAKSISASISLAGVSGGGSGGGGGGAGSVSVSQNLKIDPWTSIMSGIQSILGTPQSTGPGQQQGVPAGGAGGAQNASSGVVTGQAGRASASPEFGLITVTARPLALERIRSYIDSINSRFAKNVMIDIKIYNLSLDNQSSLGFSLDALYQELGGLGVSVVGSQPLQAGTSLPGQLTLSSSDPASRFNGSKAVLQALQQFGNVALQTQGQVIAINGQPSPIQVANEVNYLASSSTTTAANVGTTSTLTPGTRVVGFTANFLPLILDDNRIQLQYAIQLSALTALTQVSSGTSSIQTPQISSQSLQQQAFVRDGQAIVLFGFDQNRDTANTAAGIGGASTASRSERQMVVIVMQVSGGLKDE